MKDALEQPKTENVTLFSLLDPSLMGPADDAVHFSIYRVMCADGDPAQRTRFRLPDASVLVMHTQIHSDAISAEMIYDDQGNMTVSTSKLSIPEGWKLVVLQPFRVGSDNDTLVARRADEIASIFRAIKGRNFAWELQAQFVEDVNHRIHGFGQLHINPHAIPRVITTPDSLSDISAVIAAMRGQDEAALHRLNTSFHWYGKSVTTVDGTDAMVFMFVAWEALSFNGTNINSLNHPLSAIYGTTPREASERFLCGRIHRLRSEIVHQGLRTSIHAYLLEYMEAVYVDVLLHKLNLPSERRVEAVMSKPGFDLLSYLRFDRHQ